MRDYPFDKVMAERLFAGAVSYLITAMEKFGQGLEMCCGRIVDIAVGAARSKRGPRRRPGVTSPARAAGEQPLVTSMLPFARAAPVLAYEQRMREALG
ncbi:hypothetical protein [Streptomyces sp. A1277]|uniref:hypothetical protein n=1 Tax=Streptomyces sp. A1277 TaxID=2563103 RepID=UPI00144570EF|nr:hypothetical protein [Streptomyces sp. A1277]